MSGKMLDVTWKAENYPLPENLRVHVRPARYAAIEHPHVYQIVRIQGHTIPRRLDISLRESDIFWYPGNRALDSISKGKSVVRTTQAV